MNRNCLTLVSIFLLTWTISAQQYPAQEICTCQNVPNQPATNINNFPAGNNLPTNNLPFISSLPVDSNSPVNKLQLLAGLPFINGLINEVPNTAQGNLLPVGNEFTNVPNVAMNNFLSNNLSPACNLALPNNLPSNVQINNAPAMPTPNTLIPLNPALSGLLSGGNFANKGLSLNGLANNGIVAPATIFNNGFPNGFTNIQNLNSLPINAPKISRSILSNSFIGKNGLPLVNNPFGNILENNGLIYTKQSVAPTNELQMSNVLPNNGQIVSGLASNGVSINNGLPVYNGLPINSQIPNNFPVNSVPISIGDNTLGSLNSFAANNLNQIQPCNIQPITNTLQLPCKELPFNSAPLVEGIQTGYNALGGAQSFISALPVTSLPLCSLPAGNLLASTKPVGNIGRSLPFAKNINLPGASPNFNLLNLGEVGNLPIFSGLPIIGVSETVTVINTAPSVYL